MSTALIWSKLKYQNKFHELSRLRFRSVLHLRGKSTMTTASSPTRRYMNSSPTRSLRPNNGQNNNDGQVNDPKKSSRIWSVWGDKTGINGQTTPPRQQGPPIIQFTSSQSSLKSEVPPAGAEQSLEEEYTVATDSKRQLEVPHEEQEPKRTWRFWSRSSSVNTDIAQEQQQNDGEQVVLPPKAATTLTNTWIPAEDVIVYKSAAAKRDLKNQTDTPEPNIVVPNFDILPHKSVWNSVQSSALALARRWNVVTGAPAQKCVYQQGPQAKLKHLSEDEIGRAHV